MKIFKKIVLFIITMTACSSLATFCEAFITGDAIYTGDINDFLSKIFQLTVLLCGGVFIHQLLKERYGGRRFKKPSPYCQYCNERIGYFGKYRHHCEEEENHIEGII
jgi:hypothetical protein